MRDAIIDYFALRTLGVVERLTALRKIRSRLEVLERPTELPDLVDQALAEDKQLYDLETRWRHRKRHRVLHGDKARDLDRQLDRLLAGLEATIAARASMKAIFEQQGILAERMHRALFPLGLAGVTQRPYHEQAIATNALLQRLDDDEDFRSFVQELGLSPVLATIRSLNEEFSRQACASNPLSFEELEERRREGQLRLGRIVLAILALFPNESEHDKDQRRYLLAPIEQQSEKQRQLARKRARGRKAANGNKERRAEMPDAPFPDAA